MEKESVEYKKLMETLEELKRAEEIAQEERIKAYAANQAKSSFLANVSHEIRTPINAVIGLNEMILRESTEDKVKEYAMDVNAAAMQLLSIINDILDISKIEAGRMEVIPTEYELATMINDLVNMVEVRAKEKGLKFVVKVDENLPSKLLGDDLRLKQVISNLLSNGVKYTKEGTVTFCISGQKKQDNLDLFISVEDTGVGIKPEEMVNLFESFQRLDERSNRNIEGTGLGMAISNELLNMMGSKVEVESEFGKGSKFYFTVEQKIIDPSPVGNLEEIIKNNSKGYSHTISFTAPDAKLLVVDDNSINRKVVIGLLKEIGCTIDEANGGYECLEMVKKKHYDLIFLDHLMPDLDGVGTLEKLKSEENLCNDSPVVAFTANAVSGMRESFLATGFSGFVSKPVSADKLEEALVEFLPKELVKEGNIVFSHESKNQVEEELPDLDDFDFRYAKLCLKDEKLIRSVAQEFYLSLDRIKDEITGYEANLAEKATMDSYRTCVHGLKSTSRMLGEFTLSGLAKTAEDGAKAYDLDKVMVVQPLLLDEIDRAKDELSIFKPEQVAKKQMSRADLENVLEKMKKSLNDRNVKSVDKLAEEISACIFEEDFAESLEQLLDYVKMLKLLKASALVDELLLGLRG